MVFLVFFLLFVSSLDSIESRYALVIKDASNCMANPKVNIVLHNKTSDLSKSDIGYGYVEFIEAIEPNHNFQIGIETHHRGISNSIKFPSVNVQKQDLCHYLSTDLLFMPLLRRVFDLEKFCPIAKGKHVFYTDTIVSKLRPYIPLGCWIIVTRIAKKQIQPFACYNLTIQSLPSRKSEPYKCT